MKLIGPMPAKRLAVGDSFVTSAQLAAATREGWCRVLRDHVLTPRGDYASVIETDGTTWTERYDPEEPVWLVEVEPVAHHQEPPVTG